MSVPILSLAAALSAAATVHAQPARFERLAAGELPVRPPSGRVEGPPGAMRVTHSACPTAPVPELRRRIVDIAVQEWAYFGFQVVDRTGDEDSGPRRPRDWRGFSWLTPEESERVAHSIAGYWSVTSRGGWILERQNAVWKGPQGVAARWRDPWSAAFVSWVMCEAGLGEQGRFRRAIAHYSYIDQAIEARGHDASPAAYAAFDVGERPVEPGDLLCSARRSAYRTIAERRRDLGRAVRSHCDIVVKLDPANDRILGIGGNVRGAVSLKLLPAVFEEVAGAAPAVRSVGSGRRAVFAHLQLRAGSIGPDALATSATLRALREHAGALLRKVDTPSRPGPATP